MFELNKVAAAFYGTTGLLILSLTPGASAQVAEESFLTPGAHAPQQVDAPADIQPDAQAPSPETLESLYLRGIDEMSQWRFTEATATFEALREQDSQGEYAARIDRRMAEIALYSSGERPAPMSAAPVATDQGEEEEGTQEERPMKRGPAIATSVGVGSFVGLGVGTAVGLGLGLQAYDDMVTDAGPWEPGQGLVLAIMGPILVGTSTALGATVGILGGAAIGGGVGAYRTQELEPKATSRTLRLSPIFSRRGERSMYGLGLSGSF